MLAPQPPEHASVVRHILDSAGVPSRLRHIQQFVWRGGQIRFRGNADGDVYYELRAEWETSALDPITSAAGLEPYSKAVVEGRWVPRMTGYVLRVGIDLNSPSSIYIRTNRLVSCVPFLHRRLAEVERSLAADLDAYVEWFLSHCQPVPVAERRRSQR